MLNLFKLPIEKSSLEAWSKLSDDVAKVVILYGEQPLFLKGLNISFLLIITYVCLVMGHKFRQLVEGK